MSYLLVVAAGISVALQQVLNADLRTGLGSPWWAGFISYLGGTRLGAATTLALIIGGQMLGSLIFDHVGLLSVPQHPVTPVRLLGAVLLIGAVVLVRS